MIVSHFYSIIRAWVCTYVKSVNCVLIVLYIIRKISINKYQKLILKRIDATKI